MQWHHIVKLFIIGCLILFKEHRSGSNGLDIILGIFRSDVSHVEEKTDIQAQALMFAEHNECMGSIGKMW